MIVTEYQATAERIKKRALHMTQKLTRSSTFDTGVREQARLLSDLEKYGIISNDTLPTFKPETKTQLRYNNLPAQNKFFYGRDAILATLRRELDHNPNSLGFRSWAISGMGGIGTTQVALAYAHERRSKGVSAVFWINCETGLASRLDPEGAIADEDSDQNQFIVTKWLRQASKMNTTP
jgi:hypothetical protein